KMEILDEELLDRQEVANVYEAQFRAAGLLDQGLVLPEVGKEQTCAWAQYTVRVKRREAVRERLHEKGILTTVHYPVPINRQPAYATHSSLAIGDKVASEVLSLPMHPYLNGSDVAELVSGLAAAR